jgi:hypothetical protein
MRLGTTKVIRRRLVRAKGCVFKKVKKVGKQQQQQQQRQQH